MTLPSFPSFACCSAIEAPGFTQTLDGTVVIHETGIFQTSLIVILNNFPRLEDGTVTENSLPPGYTTGCGSSVSLLKFFKINTLNKKQNFSSCKMVMIQQLFTKLVVLVLMGKQLGKYMQFNL